MQRNKLKKYTSIWQVLSPSKNHAFYVLLGIILVLSYGCDSTLSDRTNRLSADKVVLIFNDSANGKIFKERRAKIKYIDDALVPCLFPLDTVRKEKKLVINTERDFIEVAYQDKSLTTQSLLLKNGDSLLLTVKEEKPFIKILNRHPRPFDMNYERKRNNVLYQGKPSKVEDYYYLWRLTNNRFSMVDGNDMANDLYELKERALESLVTENQFLDSLLKNNLVSKEVAGFYRLKNNFEKKKLKLYNPDSIDFSNGGLTKGIFSGNKELVDSARQLLGYVFYDDLLFLLYHHFFLAEVNANAASEVSLLYDAIKNNDRLGEEVKKSLLLKHMEHLIPLLSVEKTKQSIIHFQTDFPNQAWEDYLRNKFKVGMPYSSDLHVRSFNNDVTTFEEILGENKGKIIYVDFWASWCIPCIRSFPASRELQKAYKDEDIAFIYLSIDKDAEIWKKAATKYGLRRNGLSYLVDPSYPSDLIKSLEVTSIPRYLLYDMQGNLVHKNAPRPGSEEIRKLLDLYLRK